MKVLLTRIQSGQEASLTTLETAHALDALLRAVGRENWKSSSKNTANHPLLRWADSIADLLVERWRTAGKFDEKLDHYRRKEEDRKTTPQDLVRLRALERSANRLVAGEAIALSEEARRELTPDASASPALAYLTSAY